MRHAPPSAADAGEAARLEAQLAAWVGGIGHELRFWDAWLASRGLRWPEDYARRLDPEAALEARAADVARGVARPGGHVRILDVGAGPVTGLGYRADGLAVEVEATDPLAPLYATLLARHGVSPPVATRFAPVEDLGLFVSGGGYDLVHCRNALDHSLDPLRGIERMLAAARVGGAVLLRHFADEAVREHYAGLHQWNFALRDDGTRFVVWNRSGETDVATSLRCPCRIDCQGDADWVDVLIEKTGDVPPEPPDESSRRLAAWLEATVRLLGHHALHSAVGGDCPVPAAPSPPGPLGHAGARGELAEEATPP